MICEFVFTALKQFLLLHNQILQLFSAVLPLKRLYLAADAFIWKPMFIFAII